MKPPTPTTAMIEAAELADSIAFGNLETLLNQRTRLSLSPGQFAYQAIVDAVATVKALAAAPHPTKPHPAYAPDHPKNLEDGTPCQYVSRAQPADITAKVERLFERWPEVAEADEHISQAMLDNTSTEISEEGGGMQSARTMVLCNYNDLRIVLGFVDKVRAAREALSSQRAEGIEAAAVERGSDAWGWKMHAERLQQQLDAATLLNPPDYLEQVQAALDRIGAPRKSADGMIHFGIIDRINALTQDAG